MAQSYGNLRTLALALLAALSIARVAAQSEPAASEAEPAARPEQIEEITVVGQRSRRDLRLEVQLARERVYDLFNSLNTDSEFDIHCRDAAMTGTRMTQRVCRPQFAVNATGEGAAVFLNAVLFRCELNSPEYEACFNNQISLAQGVMSVVPGKEQQLSAEVQRLARENGEFRRVIAEYQRAERRYEHARRTEGLAPGASVSIIDSGRARHAAPEDAGTPPRPLELVPPEVPWKLPGGAAREGWVKLRYSVLADGSTADIRVIDAAPPGLDAATTISAAAAWRFEPATAGQAAIDWHNNSAVVVFNRETTAHDGWLALAEAYADVAALIADGRFAEAKSRNEQMQQALAFTLEEIALAQMQLAAIEHALGDLHAALAAIRRATEAAIPQLATEEVALALEHRFALEVELGLAVDALETFERRAAFSRVRSRDPLARRAAALRRALEAPETSLTAQGRIDESGRWEHALTWDTFAVGGVNGRNDSLEVECHRRKTQLPFQPDVEVTVPAAWGECGVLLRGQPGTTFTLYEFREPIGQ